MGGKVFLRKQKRLVTHQKPANAFFYLIFFASLMGYILFCLAKKIPPILQNLSQTRGFISESFLNALKKPRL